MLIRTVAALGLLAAVGACGDTVAERAITGGAAGAGVGAGAAAVTGANPWTGAAIGGAVGAATGGLTDQDDLDLGDTPWD